MHKRRRHTLVTLVTPATLLFLRVPRIANDIARIYWRKYSPGDNGKRKQKQKQKQKQIEKQMDRGACATRRIFAKGV